MSESLMSQVEKVLPQHWANKLDSEPDCFKGDKVATEFELFTAAMGSKEEELKFARKVIALQRRGTGVDLDIRMGKDGEYMSFGLCRPSLVHEK